MANPSTTGGWPPPSQVWRLCRDEFGQARQAVSIVRLRNWMLSGMWRMLSRRLLDFQCWRWLV